MKRIVICSDGTWGTPDQELPSNVTRLARAVLPTAPDGTAQVVFYDAGVGTEGSWFYRAVGAGERQGNPEKHPGLLPLHHAQLR